MKTRNKSVILNLFQNLTTKTIIATALISVSTTAFASLSDCYRAGAKGYFEQAISDCKPYANSDIAATGIYAGSLAHESKQAESVPYLMKYLEYYKNHPIQDAIVVGSLYGALGNIYYFGQAEPKYPKDTTKGIKYITKGAELGSPIAQEQLGSFYHSGKTLPKNFAISYYWYTLGKLNGGSSYSQKAPSYVYQNLSSFKKELPYCIAVGNQMVAQAYIDGFGGLPRDKSAAKKYLTEAIDLYKADGKPTADEIKYCSPPKGSDISLESAEKLYKSL
ncbi:SEL1-like repeat protein [Francisella philomiragia]|uniref:SEL1-like repeat protein n=1 Tax=Francisella philomiragia TaxID=28110 RepID=UPI001905B9E3|nr:SEL1-like repeat protein [Francisella philomiragia]MBK2267618.1 sel1 repeat family protein [Francisella philomiragia]MBK2279283.1 sel1 repeat family protein [Francisella philomiragia]MBK2286928.1 sel1 repeat family protein [Francisella philomiragia]MBK2289115.1 sel1 repeat family protein [Francisella philomiragia]MBK2290833.1 sel1 repeat family protein [Francisella philomiragia]